MYKKFCGDLENIGSEFNTYYPCVSNRIRLEKQHTIRFFVEVVMYNHVNTKFNDKFKGRMNCNYGKHDEVKANRGKVHEYLGMTFDFTEKENTKIKMDNYVESMINDY